MRNFIAGLFLVGFFSFQVIAEAESLAKLSAEGVCKEYGYQRGSVELDGCIENVLKAAARPVKHEPIGQLYDVAGNVQIVVEGQPLQAVAKGVLLENNTIVSTGENSLAVLKFLDGQVIVLQENSALQIHDYRYNANNINQSNLFFSILKGGIRSINGLIGSKHPAAFRIETLDATLGVQNSDFMLVLNDQMYSQVSSGLLQMDNEAGTTVLISGQTAVVASANTLPVLKNADDLAPEIFTKLIRIPVPDTNPIVLNQPTVNALGVSTPPTVTGNPSQNSADTVTQQERASAENMCDGLGYTKGSDDYKQCVENAIKAAQIENANSVGRVFSATGDVEVTSDEAPVETGSQKKNVAKGARLKKKMHVYTGEKSQAVLKFKDGQVVTMQPNTTFQIKDYRYDSNDASKSNIGFSMINGGIRAITGSIGHEHPEAFKLETRSAVLGVRGTDFMVIMDDQTYSQVSSGSISMSNEAGTAVLNAGQTAAVTSATTLPALMKTEELPPKIASNFSELKAIPTPPPTPTMNDIGQPPPNSVDNQNKRADETFCASYGYTKGTPEYDQCLIFAAENGYAGDATKYQEAGQESLGNSLKSGGQKKLRY